MTCQQLLAITLKGKWLEELGFHLGDYVQGKCENGQLIITPDVNKAQAQEAKTAFMDEEMKKIEIDGKAVAFKASAAIPRIYRIKFQRDIYQDLSVLEKSIGGGDPEKSSLDLFSLEMFENIAYVMAKHADPSIPDNPEEWLDEFNTFSIYQVLPKLIELWGMNIRTDVEAKKNFMQQTVK